MGKGHRGKKEEWEEQTLGAQSCSIHPSTSYPKSHDVAAATMRLKKKNRANSGQICWT